MCFKENEGKKIKAQHVSLERTLESQLLQKFFKGFLLTLWGVVFFWGGVEWG